MKDRVNLDWVGCGEEAQGKHREAQGQALPFSSPLARKTRMEGADLH